jgi:hypothetical protein
MRRGYDAEYYTKKELEKQYPVVIKIAIGQYPVRGDFLCVVGNRIDKVVEVKQVHGEKYSPARREVEQLSDIKDFCAKNNIKFEVWIWKIVKKRRVLEIRKMV